jgi:hypothetical protein
MARVAIQGTLEEAPLPDVIQLLSMWRKTGCLTLTEREMQGEICLDQGRVCHAAVFSRRDRLGDMLVRRGRITQQQLDAAIAQQRAGGKRVSQTLLESGQLAQSELEQFVRRQVEAVYFMFTWRTGTFAFTAACAAPGRPRLDRPRSLPGAPGGRVEPHRRRSPRSTSCSSSTGHISTPRRRH